MKIVFAGLTRFVVLLSSAVARKVELNTRVETMLPANSTSSIVNTTSEISTTLRTIYTSPPNATVMLPHMYLFELTAYVNKTTKHAHYSFLWWIEPDFDAVRCTASAAASDGKLDDVVKSQCWQDQPGLKPPNDTSLAHFSFAWEHVYNGTVLILRSTNPASAHHCPSFPHDACWAQGLHWISPKNIKWIGGVQRFVGDSTLQFLGTYCESGMEECTWSEYLY